MEYKYAKNDNYEDFASGRVLYHVGGEPTFPVRLSLEIYERCLQYSNNHEWNKQISEDKKNIICQHCGYQWKYKSMPLFVLTGCSGVGKTTTAQELIQRDIDFIVMDADFLYNIMPHETEKDYKN